MDFRGHLRLPDDAGTGIPVELRLDDIFVVISSGEEELGTWRADDVVIERIYSNQFAIELDGESMVFIAQDALGFAYDGVSAIEDLQERLTKRRVFKRSKKNPKKSEAEQVGVHEAEQTPSETEPDLEDSETPAEVPAEVPKEVAAEVEAPLLAVEPKPIWSPPAASAPAAPAEIEPEPVQESPVQPRVEPPTARPDDVRVSYPPSSPPPPPSVESFVPPSEESEESPATPGAGPAPVPPDEAPEAPAAERQSVSAVEDEAAVTAPEPSAVASQPEPRVVEPDFEIEEVAPAATGAIWYDVEDEPVAEEPEMEIEEFVLPSAGAADMFTAPVPPIEDAVTEAPEERVVDDEATGTEAEELRETAARAGMGDASSSEVVETSDSEGLSGEGKHVAKRKSVADDPPSERAVASNGHAAVDSESRTAKRERRHTLFGRSRDKKAPPHEHQYGKPKTIGGLTRQVCEVCGHVTFSGEDVYQGW